MNAKLIGVNEVCEQLNMSRAYAYKVIRKLNAEMQGNGCLAVPGKVSRSFFSAEGRDVQFQELKLRLKDCIWELVGKTSEEELEERDVPDCVMRTLDFMSRGVGIWQGTMSNLMEAAGVGTVRKSCPIFIARRRNHALAHFGETLVSIFKWV